MKKLAFISTIMIMIFSSCEKISDFYFGLHMQPDFLKDDFHEGLNIFGIIMPDDSGINNSFVHVQKVIRAVDDTTKDIEIRSADIIVYPLKENEPIDTIYFNIEKEPSASYNKYIPDSTFSPKGGEVFEMNCVTDGLPELGGVTIVPQKPQIEELSVSENKILFNIMKDTSAYLYKIYLINEGELMFDKLIVPSALENTVVEIINITATKLIIYAFDKNLSAYMANSNTAFNINKFRQYDNQVTNGYGVFGSLNFSEFKFSE